jgi:hypothetical protein
LLIDFTHFGPPIGLFSFPAIRAARRSSSATGPNGGSGKGIDDIGQRQSIEFALHASLFVALALFPVKREEMRDVVLSQLFLVISHNFSGFASSPTAPCPHL